MTNPNIAFAYAAHSLSDIADYFETLASDQIGCVRFQQTKRGKDDCLLRAEIWTDAANLLRQTSLTGEA